jgi:hypothetical protein
MCARARQFQYDILHKTTTNEHRFMQRYICHCARHEGMWEEVEVYVNPFLTSALYKGSVISFTPPPPHALSPGTTPGTHRIYGWARPKSGRDN